MSLGSAAASKPATGGKSMKDLEKEKAQAGIWGAGQKPAGAPVGAAMGSGFGNFGGGSFGTSGTGGASSSAGGGDDLLL